MFNATRVRRGPSCGPWIVFNGGRAVDSAPTYADAFRGLGIAHARSRRLEQALGAYTLFTDLAPAGHRDIPKIRKIIIDYYEAASRRRSGR